MEVFLRPKRFAKVDQITNNSMLKEKKGADKKRAEAAKARKAAAAAAKAAVVIRKVNPQDRLPGYDEKLAAESRRSGSRRRSVAQELAKKEEEELERSLLYKKFGKEKVTRAELERKKEEEEAAIRRKIEKKNRRITIAKEYEKLVDVKNTNKTEMVIDAHTIDEAINQLYIADDHTKDPKLRAMFKAFGEEQLPKMKEEKPGLSDSQYKNLMWKLWKRSGGYVGEKVCLDSNSLKREERKSRGKVLVWES